MSKQLLVRVLPPLTVGRSRAYLIAPMVCPGPRVSGRKPPERAIRFTRNPRQWLVFPLQSTYHRLGWSFWEPQRSMKVISFRAPEVTMTLG